MVSKPHPDLEPLPSPPRNALADRLEAERQPEPIEQELSSVPIAVYPPIPMLLWCPECGVRHVDKGKFATTKHHHTHACQHCGHCWRPAIVATVGVQFLPGFKDE